MNLKSYEAARLGTNSARAKAAPEFDGPRSNAPIATSRSIAAFMADGTSSVGLVAALPLNAG